MQLSFWGIIILLISSSIQLPKGNFLKTLLRVYIQVNL